ncbi:MAG TPA: response regulator [Burkholderiales bacterium]|nr:response regulator [Burkholderiales bacterium]
MKRAHTPTVFIVDDDEAGCEALSIMLRKAGFKVEAFASAAEFLEQYRPRRFGCLVLDVRMPGMTGLELQERLVQGRSRLPIVFLTGHGDVEMAVHAMRKGAFDFLQKPVDDGVLLDSVRAALAFAAEQLCATSRGTPSVPGIETLSEREREVLDLILAGKQTRAIADDLFISQKTVEFHRGRIHEKLGVSSLAELFSLWYGQEFVRPPGR